MTPVTPAAAQAPHPAPAAQSAPTTQTLGTNLLHRSFTQDGMQREYLIKLPDNRDPARTYPVVLAFGGKGDSATSFRSYAGLEQATAGGAIIIYAQGVDNVWAGAPYATTTLQQDIAYVRTAVDDVVAHHGGDRNRVYAVGMSNGGGMATALGCHAPELVNATASVAGAYYDPTVTGCNPRGGVPTLVIHGTNDTLMNYWGGTRHGAHYQGPTRCSSPPRHVTTAPCRWSTRFTNTRTAPPSGRRSAQLPQSLCGSTEGDTSGPTPPPWRISAGVSCSVSRFRQMAPRRCRDG